VFKSNFDESNSFLQIINYLSFHISAFLKIFTIPRPDYVLTYTQPPLIGSLGAIFNYLGISKHIHIVDDLYPEVPIRLEYLSQNSLFAKLCKKITKWILNHSKYIVALSENMRHQIMNYYDIPKEKIYIIPYWADSQCIYPLGKESNWFVKKHGLEDKFVVQYSGHMGRGHLFEPVLNAAKQLEKHEDIVFLFIGDGPEKKRICDFKQTEGLMNIKVLPYQDIADLPYSLSAADVSIVSLKPELAGLMVPSKIYGIMATKRPVIFIGSIKSEISITLKDADCGFTIEPNGLNPAEEIVHKILYLYNNPKLRSKFGENALSYFKQKFDREMSTNKYLNLLNVPD
jgi:glycosyltransferase involved in cell wall biosynthesis